MNSKSRLMFAVSIAVLLSILMSLTAAANPTAPGKEFVGPERPDGAGCKSGHRPSGGPRFKPIDQPNPKDYQRNEERMRLLEAGQTAEAASLALSGSDRVLGHPGRVRRH